MIKDKRGRILCELSGKLCYISPAFTKSEQFKVLGWKIVETPEKKNVGIVINKNLKP